MRPWTTLTRDNRLDHPLLRVDMARRRREPGLERDFIVLTSPDWVNVVPITAHGEVVLIRQWRHGTEAETLEIPGGVVDAGESPRQAGLRELAEETGYQAGRVEELGWVEPNPALFTNRCHTLLATDCHRVGEQRPEDTEEIEVLTRPLDEVPGLVASGAIGHSLVVAALALMWLKRPGLAPGPDM